MLCFGFLLFFFFNKSALNYVSVGKASSSIVSQVFFFRFWLLLWKKQHSASHWKQCILQQCERKHRNAEMWWCVLLDVTGVISANFQCYLKKKKKKQLPWEKPLAGGVKLWLNSWPVIRMQEAEFHVPPLPSCGTLRGGGGGALRHGGTEQMVNVRRAHACHHHLH